MKKAAVKIILSLTSILFSASLFAADTYTLDPKHTYVLWHINHFGFSNPSGKWMAEGTLVIDDGQADNSKVSATIHTDTLATGLADLDEHLKGPLFFDVKQFPTATFVSNKVKVTSKNTAVVTGMLTLHGVTKPVTLHVTLNKEAINPISNKPSVGFSATAKIKRSDFGITTLLPGLSDDVELDIQAEGYK